MSNDGLQMMLPIRFINDLVFTSQAHLKHDHLADYRWNSGQVTTWCSHLKHDHLADNRWNSGQVMIDDRSSKRPRLTSDSDVQAEERRSMPALACCYWVLHDAQPPRFHSRRSLLLVGDRALFRSHSWRKRRGPRPRRPVWWLGFSNDGSFLIMCVSFPRFGSDCHHTFSIEKLFMEFGRLLWGLYCFVIYRHGLLDPN